MSATAGTTVETLLHRADRWLALAAAVHAAAIALAILLATASTLILLDAVFAFGPAGLIAGDVLLATLVLVGMVYAIRHAWRRSPNPRFVARLLEERLTLRDNPLINAVDFTLAPPTSSSRQLAEHQMQAADALAAHISPRAAADLFPPRPAGLALSLAAACTLLLILLPGVSPAVLPRFRHPLAGLPPFTLLHFAVVTQPATIFPNQPASIQAAITGPESPDHADVVFLNGDRPNATQPMLRDDDGKYVLQFDRVEHSQVFYIATPRGRSRLYTLAVTPTPLAIKTENLMVATPQDLQARLRELHDEQQRLQKELTELKQNLLAMVLPDDALRRQIDQDELALAKCDDAAAKLAATLHERGAQTQRPLDSLQAGLPSSHSGSPSSVSLSGHASRPNLTGHPPPPTPALTLGSGPGAGQNRSHDAPISQSESQETLAPAADANRNAAAMGLQGVPVPYRDQAQAYFQRLAQDSRDQKMKPAAP